MILRILLSVQSRHAGQGAFLLAHPLAENARKGFGIHPDQDHVKHAVGGHLIEPPGAFPDRQSQSGPLFGSQAVEARSLPWHIRLRSGDELTGLITAETANNLVLRPAGGVDHPVLRSDVTSATRQADSLMPSGFESAPDLQAMADLLAWLRGG